VTNISDIIKSIEPERREKILDRAEELIREERARRGRSAPESNQNAAPAGLPSWVTMIIGFFIGVLFGLSIANINAVHRYDHCRARASSARVSFCLDNQGPQ
jgi:hypothetical protein